MMNMRPVLAVPPPPTKPVTVSTAGSFMMMSTCCSSSRGLPGMRYPARLNGTAETACVLLRERTFRNESVENNAENGRENRNHQRHRLVAKDTRKERA